MCLACPRQVYGSLSPVTVAAGMGCDIPDIAVAVIYGVESFVSFVQKGGRAGRDGKVGAKMVWLVEDWVFEDEGGMGGKRVEERRAKVDPMASQYICCQMDGRCLREFMRRAFRPEPKKLDLPGFDERGTGGLEILWVFEGRKEPPEVGECCSASSCRAPGSSLNAGFLTDEEKADAKARHKVILDVFKHNTSAVQDILGPAPGRTGIRCPKEEREILCATLKEWRDSHWESVSKTSPMLSRDWILGEYNLKKVTDSIRLIIHTDKEKIDRRWVRALIESAADNSAIDGLASVIRCFHDEFFARLKERSRHLSKQQKVSSSQQRPQSPTVSTFTQDSDLEPDYLPSQRYDDSGSGSLWGKRKLVGTAQTMANVSGSFPRQLCLYSSKPHAGIPAIATIVLAAASSTATSENADVT